MLTSCHVCPELNGHVFMSPPKYHTVHNLMYKATIRKSSGYKGDLPQTSTPAKTIDVCFGRAPVCLVELLSLVTTCTGSSEYGRHHQCSRLAIGR